MKVTFDNSVGTRLNEFILILNISQGAFAQSIGVSRGFLNDVLRGRKGLGGIPLVNVAKVYRQLNVRWLLTGEGAMYEYPSYYPPPELESGIPDKLEEGVRIEYARPEGQATTQARLDDHERRLRILEGRK